MKHQTFFFILIKMPKYNCSEALLCCTSPLALQVTINMAKTIVRREVTSIILPWHNNMVFIISVHSHEKQCFLQQKRKTFALQKGSPFILQWEARYKNRKDGLLKVSIFTLIFNNSCQPCLSSHSYDSLHAGIQVLSNL